MKDNRPLKKTLAFQTFRELQKVWKAQRKLGDYKLPVPRQKGWQSTFSVREDVMLTSKAQVYLDILPYIQKHKVNRKLENFRMNGYNVEYRQDVDGIWQDVSMESIPVWKKDKIPFPEHYWTKYFKLVNSEYNHYGTPVKKYVLRNEYLRCFQSKIEPHMIYKIPIIDPALESQQHILNNRMKQNDYWKYIYGNTDDGYHYEGFELKQKELLEEFYQEIRKELK